MSYLLINPHRPCYANPKSNLYSTSTALPADFVRTVPKTDLLINPNIGSNVSSSFILNPSMATDVVLLEVGVIVIPILLIFVLSGVPVGVPNTVLNRISEVILYPVPESGVIVVV